jgi:hypothetical protein
LLQCLTPVTAAGLQLLRKAISVRLLGCSFVASAAAGTLACLADTAQKDAAAAAAAMPTYDDAVLQQLLWRLLLQVP